MLLHEWTVLKKNGKEKEWAALSWGVTERMILFHGLLETQPLSPTMYAEVILSFLGHISWASV